MKKLILSLTIAGVAGLLATASAQPAGDENLPPGGGPPEMGGGPEAGGPPAGLMPGGDTTESNQTAHATMLITPSQSQPAEQEQIQSNFVPPTKVGTNASGDLNLNFNRAPLELVLNYLSDAAGFIIVQETRINSGVTVTVNGKHLTRDEATDLLNTVLNQHGYAAIRDGRTLTIVDKNDAKTREIPVKSGNKPDGIPRNAEIVTQIIPIRFVEARQLVSDLSSFVSPQATVVANEAGNSIVITDTQANIHHLAEIIKAVDDSAEAETEIQVFTLKYANPNDVATELTTVFPSSGSSGSSSQSPIRFGGPGGPGGPGGFFARMMAGNTGSSSGSSSDRIKKATQVSAVADARISAVIVTAPKELMQEIATMMKELDVASDRDQGVFVFKMNNGDPQQAALILQNMFQSTSSRSSSSSSSQNSALYQRQVNNASTTSSSSSSSGFGSSSSGGRSGGMGSAQ